MRFPCYVTKSAARESWRTHRATMQAVALAARILGISATIVMPKDAPTVKLKATSDYGVKVVQFDPEEETREQVALRLISSGNLHLIKPFDDPNIIAGQGTAAAELLEETGPLDSLLVPCGGGGLLSGSAIAAKNLSPQCQVIGIEPELADDATRSFRTGVLHTVRNPETIADGTRTHSLGELTFPLLQQLVHAMQTVTESAICEATRFLFYRTKLVVEPSGALGIAALLSGAFKPKGRVGVIHSGGNVDAKTMRQILKQ